MDGRFRVLSPGVTGFFIFLFSLAAAFLTADKSFFEFLHLKSVNTFFRVRGSLPEPDSSIALVLIDDLTLQKLDRPWPYPGSYYACIVRNLAKASARLIVFDLEFIETNAARPEEDFEFAEAIHESKRTILAGKIVYEMSKRGRPKGYLLKPNPWLEEVAASWGLMNRVEDSDGFVRRYTLFEEIEGQVYYPLAVTVICVLENPIIPVEANRHGGEFILGKYRIPKAPDNTMVINFSGPPTKSFPTFSFLQLFDDSSLYQPGKDFETFAELLEKKVFADKIVFIGASASLIGQNRRVPLVGDPEGYFEMSDAEMHAHALSTIRRELFIKPADPFMQAVLLITVVLTVLWISFAGRPFAGFLAVLLLFALMQGIGLLLFIKKGLLLNLTEPFVGAFFAYFSVAAYKQIKKRREKLQIQTFYSRRISPDVVEKLSRYGEFTERGLVSCSATLLCGMMVWPDDSSSDIAAVRKQFADFFKSAARLVLRREGSLDFVFGSRFVAVFGMPLKAADHADRGCAAMTEMLKSRLKKFENKGEAERPHMAFALHTGEFMLADIEDFDTPDYRLVGEEAAVVMSLASANSLYGTTALITETALTEMRIKPLVREIDWVSCNSRLLRIYELLSVEEDSPERCRFLIEAFAEGLQLYRNRSWTEALKIFRRILRRFSEDGPSRLYVVRCLDCLEHPPAEDWTGITFLNEKRPFNRTAVGN